MRYRTRFGRLPIVVVAAALFMAACGDDDDGGDAATTTPATDSGDTTATEATTATTGDGATGEVSTSTLVVGRTGDIDNLDPHVATAFQTIDALELIYDSLTELDADLNVQPGLATEWSYNADGTELTMTLREGVTFHDGDELTSADVVASLERILDEETGAVVRSNLLSIDEITAPDDLTVVMSLSVPDATLPAALTDVIV